MSEHALSELQLAQERVKHVALDPFVTTHSNPSWIHGPAVGRSNEPYLLENVRELVVPLAVLDTFELHGFTL